MDCRDLEPLLSAWVDGQLSEDRGRHVRDHLARCPACWNALHALEQVGARLTVLKSTDVPQAPEGLLAGVRALPAWLVRFAVIRQWVALAGGVTVTWAAAWLLLSWSNPLTVTLTAQGATTSQTLRAGTMFTAKADDTIHVSLDGARGAIQLHGPGVLIIRQAAVGHLTQDQRLTMELPSGRAAIHFSPQAAAHEVRVMTPHAQVHLTGTWVQITAEPAHTEVDVLEGQAVVHQLATGRQMTIKAGERLHVEAAAVQLLAIPVEEWLARKGIVTSLEQPTPSTASAANDSPEPPRLWHEAE